jgi:hypothetical protein
MTVNHLIAKALRRGVAEPGWHVRPSSFLNRRHRSRDWTLSRTPQSFHSLDGSQLKIPAPAAGLSPRRHQPVSRTVNCPAPSRWPRPAPQPLPAIRLRWRCCRRSTRSTPGFGLLRHASVSAARYIGSISGILFGRSANRLSICERTDATTGDAFDPPARKLSDRYRASGLITRLLERPSKNVLSMVVLVESERLKASRGDCQKHLQLTRR